MIPILAGLVAALCALASARRIWFAAHATALHPEEALVVVRKQGAGVFRAAAEGDPDASWERDLLAALDSKSEGERIALVNEQLMELDFRVQRWARVPRVCASISTSVGFLLATLVLRQGIVALGPSLTPDVLELIVRGLVGDALSVAAFGLVGTTFCIAAQSHAKKIAQSRLEAVDKLVEALEKPA